MESRNAHILEELVDTYLLQVRQWTFNRPWNLIHDAIGYYVEKTSAEVNNLILSESAPR